jgi:hypothetical protein
MPLIDAYDTRTGKRVVVPDSWIGHPVLGRGYALTPPSPKTPPPAAVVAVPARTSRRQAVQDATTAPAVVEELAPAAGDTEQESDPRC